jgi:hypothetical protein
MEVGGDALRELVGAEWLIKIKFHHLQLFHDKVKSKEIIVIGYNS